MKTKPSPTGGLPRLEDLLLVIEVSDTTLSYDRDVKLPRNGGSGVPEAWIVDLASRRVTVHSGPTTEGYRSTESFGAGESVGSNTVALEIPVEKIFS